ncbi:MAG: hypothetical protein E7451_03240 [Ruminococcaceae bacterium]|nr:hypothetical protein [Oscillospiraceae bacterium]
MKTYVKPQLFFESYELSQNIAACGYDMNSSFGSCTAKVDPSHGLPDLGITFFLETQGACDVTPQIYCYENGSGDVAYRLFNS